jgi:hypothetical protein
MAKLLSVADPEIIPYLARSASPFRPRCQNALRKSFSSYHYEWTGSADRTADYAGQDIRTLIKVYKHALEPEDAKRYWEIRSARPTNVVPMIAAA